MSVVRSAIESCASASASSAARGLPCSVGASAEAVQPIAGLVFDMADVLYDATAWRRWLLRLLARLGVDADFAEFYRVWDLDYLSDVYCALREFGEAFQSFLLAAGLTWAQIDEIEAASRIQRQNLELNVRPLPGVTKTIAQLTQWQLPLVAFADAPHSASRLSERLERLSLRQYFQSVLSSFDLEAAQPGAECYLSVLDALRCSAGEVAYVGHDADHLEGARTAGLRTIAVNFSPQARADVHLTRFEDLLGVVQSWLAAAPSDQASPAVHTRGPIASPFPGARR